MIVTVDEKARAFLAKHGDNTVYAYLGSCRTWGGAVPQPAVYAGSPDSPSDYDVFEDNGITVYIRKDVKAEKDTLTVTLVKMLWMETLTVNGMAYWGLIVLKKVGAVGFSTLMLGSGSAGGMKLSAWIKTAKKLLELFGGMPWSLSAILFKGGALDFRRCAFLWVNSDTVKYLEWCANVHKIKIKTLTFPTKSLTLNIWTWKLFWHLKLSTFI